MHPKDIFAIFIKFAFLVFSGAIADGPKCRFPGAPAHCSVSFSDDALSTNTVATYSCERGFELLGPGRRMCGEDGQWTPEGIPFCGEYINISVRTSLARSRSSSQASPNSAAKMCAVLRLRRYTRRWYCRWPSSQEANCSRWEKKRASSLCFLCLCGYMQIGWHAEELILETSSTLVISNFYTGVIFVRRENWSSAFSSSSIMQTWMNMNMGNAFLANDV